MVANSPRDQKHLAPSKSIFPREKFHRNRRRLTPDFEQDTDHGRGQQWFVSIPLFKLSRRSEASLRLYEELLCGVVEDFGVSALGGRLSTVSRDSVRKSGTRRQSSRQISFIYEKDGENKKEGFALPTRSREVCGEFLQTGSTKHNTLLPDDEIDRLPDEGYSGIASNDTRIRARRTSFSRKRSVDFDIPSMNDDWRRGSLGSDEFPTPGFGLTESFNLSAAQASLTVPEVSVGVCTSGPKRASSKDAAQTMGLARMAFSHADQLSRTVSSHTISMAQKHLRDTKHMAVNRKLHALQEPSIVRRSSCVSSEITENCSASGSRENNRIMKFREILVKKVLCGWHGFLAFFRKQRLVPHSPVVELPNLRIEVERSSLGLFIAGRPDADLLISTTTDWVLTRINIDNQNDSRSSADARGSLAGPYSADPHREGRIVSVEKPEVQKHFSNSANNTRTETAASSFSDGSDRVSPRAPLLSQPSRFNLNEGRPDLVPKYVCHGDVEEDRGPKLMSGPREQQYTPPVNFRQQAELNDAFIRVPQTLRKPYSLVRQGDANWLVIILLIVVVFTLLKIDPEGLWSPRNN